jgi:hypothetical protein
MTVVAQTILDHVFTTLPRGLHSLGTTRES